ncbi:Flagellar protein FliS, partial [Candidatus Arthromitus sp. SFB-3]
LNARDTYKNSSINNVSKEKLLIMLVEGGVKF